MSFRKSRVPVLHLGLLTVPRSSNSALGTNLAQTTLFETGKAKARRPSLMRPAFRLVSFQPDTLFTLSLDRPFLAL
jgi:hypothetical protein